MPAAPSSSPVNKPNSPPWYRQPFLALIIALLSLGVLMASTTLFFAISYPDQVLDRVEDPANFRASSTKAP